MKDYFDSDERRLSLRFHAAEWLGTPFAPHAMVRRAGTDCVHLVAAIYIATDFLTEFAPPAYALDSGAHAKKSQLTAWLDAHPAFLKLDARSTPQPGDTLCFNMGLSEHHVGLMLDGSQFIHVLPRRFVLLSSLTEAYYARRIASIYRPQEGAVS